MKRVSLFLTIQQIERLSRNFSLRGIKFSEQIRRAIDTYLDTEEKK